MGRRPVSSLAAPHRRRCETLGAPADEIAAITAEVRKRDARRLELKLVGGHPAGRALFSVNAGSGVRVCIPAGQQVTDRVTEDVADRLLRLPFYVGLGSDEQDEVIGAIVGFEFPGP